MVVALLFPTSPQAETGPRFGLLSQGHSPCTGLSPQVSSEGCRATELLQVSFTAELLGAESAEPIVDEDQKLSLEVFLRNGVQTEQIRSGKSGADSSLLLGETTPQATEEGSASVGWRPLCWLVLYRNLVWSSLKTRQDRSYQLRFGRLKLHREKETPGESKCKSSQGPGMSSFRRELNWGQLER